MSDEFSDMTDEQLLDYEQWLYDLECDGEDTWLVRDQAIWEINRRHL